MPHSENKLKVGPDQFAQIPMPFDLRPSIRRTCEMFDESTREYTFEGEELSLIDFFEENCDTLPASTFYTIFSLKERQTINFGGGASAAQTLKRLV